MWSFFTLCSLTVEWTNIKQRQYYQQQETIMSYAKWLCFTKRNNYLQKILNIVPLYE